VAEVVDAASLPGAAVDAVERSRPRHGAVADDDGKLAPVV
jgi:hypothetical protein